MTTAELEQLHELALNRRYDVQTAHPFDAFMAHYSDVADNPTALLALATEIDGYRIGLRATHELWSAYGQLVELARWRAAQIESTDN